jgi:hypothetical protein
MAEMKKTNFDAYLGERMKDPAFAERFRQAGAAWEKLVMSGTTPRRKTSPSRKR